MRADKDYIRELITTLYRISEPCEAGVQRRSYTDAYREGVLYVRKKMEEEGLTVWEDEAGNLFGRLKGQEQLPAIYSGSHLDTVKCAGGFDGIAGVICALEAARMIRKSGKSLRHPFVVFGTAEEEGSRFGQVVLGSKFMTGVFSEQEMDSLKETDTGQSLREVLGAYRTACPNKAAPAEIKKEDALAFLELHGEQGPLLEQEDCPIGIVNTIAGIAWLEVTVQGLAGHSGTVPMNLRQDAGIGAYRMIVDLHEYVTTQYSGKATITAGKLDLEPGSSNCIPGKCTFTWDIRSGRREIMDDILARADILAAEKRAQGYDVAIRVLSSRDPVKMNGQIQSMIEDSAEKRGLSYRYIDSGAGHDSMVFAGKWPAAMIFLPNKDGISHHPDEYIDWEDLKKGAEVLYDTIRQLDECPLSSLYNN